MEELTKNNLVLVELFSPLDQDGTNNQYYLSYRTIEYLTIRESEWNDFLRTDPPLSERNFKIIKGDIQPHIRQKVPPYLTLGDNLSQGDFAEICYLLSEELIPDLWLNTSKYESVREIKDPASDSKFLDKMIEYLTVQGYNYKDYRNDIVDLLGIFGDGQTIRTLAQMLNKSSSDMRTYRNSLVL